MRGTTRVVTSSEFYNEMCSRVRYHMDIVKDIGYVDGNRTTGQRAAVACKLGHKQRILALNKTIQALIMVEADILNDEYSYGKDYKANTHRLKMSLAQVYGKSCKITIAGVTL